MEVRWKVPWYAVEDAVEGFSACGTAACHGMSRKRTMMCMPLLRENEEFDEKESQIKNRKNNAPLKRCVRRWQRRTFQKVERREAYCQETCLSVKVARHIRGHILVRSTGSKRRLGVIEYYLFDPSSVYAFLELKQASMDLLRGGIVNRTKYC